jgi:hypothetical protein
MINVNKVDYIKIQLLENRDVSYLSDFDKFIAGIEYNEKTHKFMYGDIKYKNALDIINELDIKIKAFYKVLDDNNKEVVYNEILLTIAELMFRLRVDLGVN